MTGIKRASIQESFLIGDTMPSSHGSVLAENARLIRLNIDRGLQLAELSELTKACVNSLKGPAVNEFASVPD